MPKLMPPSHATPGPLPTPHEPVGRAPTAIHAARDAARCALALALAGLLSACATAPGQHTAESGATGGDLARDRAAIRAMAGGYRVRFRFRETVVLAPAYERAEPKQSGGHELVLVIADEPRHIELQHLLVTASGHVTKHWRQAWRYEAERRLEYAGDQTWHRRAVARKPTGGAWTQCVYGVADTPRYCGTGEWQHGNGISTWTSDEIRRPLPRREHTKRDDYNALTAVNRHTITPSGWTHEQDNTKLRVEDGKRSPLVRETGFNTYRRAPSFDYEPARAYWRETADYWRRVRSAWHERIERHDGIRRTTAIDGMAIIKPLFVQARRVRAGEKASNSAIERVFSEWTLSPNPTEFW